MFLEGSGILQVSGMVCVCLRGIQHEQRCKERDAPSAAVRSLVSGVSVMLTAGDGEKTTLQTEPNWSGALGEQTEALGCPSLPVGVAKFRWEDPRAVLSEHPGG